MQKLSKRLQAIADLITPGNRVADIGTDHGYLPVYLVQSGVCPSAIAADVREGPLECARKHIAENHLQQYITARLSDGLREFEPGEADSFVLAGMGGLLMIKILEEGADLASGAKELALGPQSDIAAVRRYVREHGMSVDREELVLEYGKFYPALHVVPKKDAPPPDRNRLEWRRRMQERLPEFCGLQRLFDVYGECLIFQRHPTLRLLLDKDEKQTRAVLQKLPEQTADERIRLRRRELTVRLEEIHILQDVTGKEEL